MTDPDLRVFQKDGKIYCSQHAYDTLTANLKPDTLQAAVAPYSSYPVGAILFVVSTKAELDAMDAEVDLQADRQEMKGKIGSHRSF